MKKNYESVIECIRKRVENSGLTLKVYKEYGEIQLAYNATHNIPLFGDVLGILSCFFTNPPEIIKIQQSFGFTEIYLTDGEFQSGKVDKNLLNMFLPNKK